MRGRLLCMVSIAGLLTSCGGGSPLDEVRFHDVPVVWRVADDLDTPSPPKSRTFLRNLYFFQQSFVRPTERGLDMVVVGPAENTNALDEVPDSTWFTNRVGWGPVAEEEVLRGPRTEGMTRGPRDGPWRVKSTKVGGVSPGFIIEDEGGHRFILKFDHPDAPELETGTDVVCQRLLWIIGYHVPDDEVVYFHPERLVLAEGALEKDISGRKRPLTPARLEQILRPLRRDTRGMIRGLTSRFLPGRPLGGFPQLGVRDDDPNDHVPHELRREVRGAWLFFAWLDHTDVKEDNALDVYVEHEGRRFVRHYFLDFGKALGGMAFIDRVAMDGFAYYIDIPSLFARWFSLGLLTEAWEHQSVPQLTGVGRLESDAFEPHLWKPFYPYIPFDVRDHRDDLWAAKILREIQPSHIAAALAAARYSEPESVAYLQRTLLSRQRKLLRWAFSRSNAISEFRREGDALCFDDLWHRDGFGNGPTRYELQWFDEAGARIASEKLETERSLCSAVPSLPSGYGVLRVHSYRLAKTLPVDVHVVADERGDYRVIGLRRH